LAKFGVANFRAGAASNRLRLRILSWCLIPMTITPSSGEPEKKSAFKNPLLYSSIVLAIAVLVVGWIFFSRWQENRELEHRSAQQASQKQRENDRVALEQLGGKDFEIQSLYATPGVIQRGESAQICYGVSNAKTVKLEPQSSPVWPSHSLCVDVSPKNTTTYTLTIADESGNTKTQTVELKVQ
jgi:hypothetical protein